jgi:hypothetical protein
MKRPDLLLPVVNWIASGTNLRRITRGLAGLRSVRPCHPSTVARISRRVGSQCLIVHEQSLQSLPTITEPIVSDHFETFAGMQENALGVATPVGARSWFVYALEPAWHRQTIAFAKRGEAVLERLSILAVLRNLIQRSSERRNDTVTPAMRLGLTGRPWGWDDVLAERRFPTRTRLSRSAARVFGRTMPDPRGIRWPAHVRMRAL